MRLPDEAQISVETADADATRALGKRLATMLRAGDLVMLSGELGAGKTTLAQGIGAGLQVRGRVCSPTFIIARVHPSLVDGPDLIHVDAYRLSSLDEVEALDLDSSLERSVTLVEWGENKVESLSADRLEIQVRRPQGLRAVAGASAPAAVANLETVDDGQRTITVKALGERWQGVNLQLLAGEQD